MNNGFDLAMLREGLMFYIVLVVSLCIHEWAHALSWNLVLDQLSTQAGIDPQDFQEASHDEAWGCAYSRVWRVYIGNILPSLASTEKNAATTLP